MTLNFILFWCQFWILKVFCGTLTFPEAIKVSNGDTLEMKAVFLNNKVYDPDDSDKLMIDMTGRALCINDICSIPGPTLIVYPGITFNIEISNEFQVKILDEDDKSAPDIFNIHSHGLHISGVQDNVFEEIYPSQTKTVTWTIHPEHHHGSNWYHVHHHTSTALHVMSGMYGALIVDSIDNKYLNYNNPSIINDYVIHISWLYLHDNEHCQNCEGFKETQGAYSYKDSEKVVQSLCTSWCKIYTDQQRENSAYNYDVKLDGSENNYLKKADTEYEGLEVFLVNDLYEPTLYNLASNQYFKLRFISSSSTLYIQLEFDYNTNTNCQYSMIARDGIALKEIERDLLLTPYYGMFVMPPGGRIDVMVLCKGNGIATIYHNELHPNYPNINVSYAMGRIEKQILFKLSVDEDLESDESEPVIDSHLVYPEPVNGFPYYLKELLSDSISVEQNCPCSDYNRDESEDVIVRETEQCSFEFVEGTWEQKEVNGVKFVDGTGPLFLISLNKMYEFYLNSDGHPFHIHVNPFQVEQDLLDGYIAKQNDWLDTLGYKNINEELVKEGNPEDVGLKIKINVKDYTGNVILHCHFLGHEDKGMMAYMKIVDGSTDDLTQCLADYDFNIVNSGGGSDDNSGGKGGKGGKAVSSKNENIKYLNYDNNDDDELFYNKMMFKQIYQIQNEMNMNNIILILLFVILSFVINLSILCVYHKMMNGKLKKINQ